MWSEKDPWLFSRPPTFPLKLHLAAAVLGVDDPQPDLSARPLHLECIHALDLLDQVLSVLCQGVGNTGEDCVGLEVSRAGRQLVTQGHRVVVVVVVESHLIESHHNCATES